MRKSIYIYMTMNGYEFDAKQKYNERISDECKPLISKTHQFTVIFSVFVMTRRCASIWIESRVVWIGEIIVVFFFVVFWLLLE